MGPVFTINSWVTTIVLFVTLNRGLANAVNYKKVGDKIVLSPGSVTAPITSITWKYNSNLAVEWFGTGEVDFYPKFKGRSELKTETGELIIPNPTPEYSGIYTPEISNRVLNPTEFKFISGVPKPTVSENCDDEKCVFTCDANTTDSEPVTYTWWSGDVMKSQTKELIVTKEETEPSFICEMKNPVSSERSTEVLNPFISTPSITENDSNSLNGWIVFLVLVLVLVLVLAAVAGVFIYKHIKGRYPPPLSALPCFKNNDVGNAKVPPGSGSEEETLLSGTNGGVQPPSFSLETVNETVTYKKVGDEIVCELENPVSSERSEEVLNPFTSSSITDAALETQGVTAKHQPSGSSSGSSDQPEEETFHSHAEVQPPSFSLETVNETGGDQESHQTETPAVSPEPNKDKPAETTEVDKTPDQSDAALETQGVTAKHQPSGSSSGTSDQPADTKVPLGSGSELELNNGGVQQQPSSSPGNVNGTEPLNPPAKPPRVDSVSGPSHQPDTTSETPETRSAPADKSSSDPLSGGQETTLQDQNDEESTGIKAENLSQRTGDKRGAGQTDGEGTTQQDQNDDESTGTKAADTEVPPLSGSGGDQESIKTQIPVVSLEPNKDEPAEKPTEKTKDEGFPPGESSSSDPLSDKRETNQQDQNDVGSKSADTEVPPLSGSAEKPTEKTKGEGSPPGESSSSDSPSDGQETTQQDKNDEESTGIKAAQGQGSGSAQAQSVDMSNSSVHSGGNTESHPTQNDGESGQTNSKPAATSEGKEKEETKQSPSDALSGGEGTSEEDQKTEESKGENLSQRTGDKRGAGQTGATSETEEKEGAPTKHQSSDPLSGGEGTTQQDKNDDESTGIKAAEKPTEETKDEGFPAGESPSSDSPSDKRETNQQDQNDDESTGIKSADTEVPPLSGPGGDQESQTPVVSPEPNKDEPEKPTEETKDEGFPAGESPSSDSPSGGEGAHTPQTKTEESKGGNSSQMTEDKGATGQSENSPENQGSLADKSPSPPPLSDGQETTQQDKNDDESTGIKAGGEGTSEEDQKNDESKAETTEVDQTPDHSNPTSKTPDNQGGPTSQEESGSSSGASVHSDHENIDIKL